MIITVASSDGKDNYSIDTPAEEDRRQLINLISSTNTMDLPDLENNELNNYKGINSDEDILLHSVEENSDPQYPMYSSFLSRLKTYDSRSPQSYQDKYSLAQCGFTYTGTDDLVQCYYCGLLLGKWEKNDEPWSQHALHNPKC
ncbi:death-associated inhibitor of apoptosis 1-like, partial [Acyrthosiphon pisum]|uniref:Uncharacterized protein n=1 Tax=Acyrthosiphon pisum TaxID=7029 RepID=A0A8R2NUK6_ACYPI